MYAMTLTARPSFKLLYRVLSLSRYLGVFPLAKDMKLSKTGISISFVSTVMLGVFFIAIINLSFSRKPLSDETNRNIMLFRLVFMIFIPALTSIKLAKYSKEFNSILEAILLNGITLKRLGSKVKLFYNDNHIWLGSITRFCLIFVNDIFSNALMPTTVTERVWRSIFIALGLASYQLVQLQFYTVLHLLETQLNVLIKHLESTPKPREYSILNVLLVVNRITTACCDLNSIYSHQALLILTLEYVSFISTSYQVFVDVKGYIYGKVLNIRPIILRGNWILYTMINFILIADKCTQTIAKVIFPQSLSYQCLFTSISIRMTAVL